jgi:hypothetical protein
LVAQRKNPDSMPALRWVLLRVFWRRIDARIADFSSRTLRKTPRRIRLFVSSTNHRSTRSSPGLSTEGGEFRRILMADEVQERLIVVALLASDNRQRRASRDSACARDDDQGNHGAGLPNT